MQGFLLQIDVSEIIVHEADEPNSLVDLLDSELLTGEHGRDVRKEKATLLVGKLDRLSRSLKFIVDLDHAGVPFVACDNPHANRLTVHILAAVAEDEREILPWMPDEPACATGLVRFPGCVRKSRTSPTDPNRL